MSTDRTIVQVRTGVRAGPGTRLNDLYEIDALIAVGGMGEVFRGHVIETGDAVAIKVMREEFAENAQALALFRKEASALHNVHHGAVVRYYVFSVDRRLGLPYLAMEYVVGESLADRLRHGPLAYDAVETLRRRLASGLAAAHAAGIVHRDVTPDNIILPDADPARAKIIDFGIARLAATQTVIGDGFAGKYAYCSPEQLGLQGGEITPRSDIYSLGLVLAQASLGRALDMGDQPAAFVAKRSTVPDLTGIDDRLVPLLESMLRPDPRMRPESMAEIEAWQVPAARAAPLPARRTEAKRGRKGILFGGAAVALAGAIAAAVFLSPTGNAPSPDTGEPLKERPADRSPPSPMPAEPPPAESQQATPPVSPTPEPQRVKPPAEEAKPTPLPSQEPQPPTQQQPTQRTKPPAQPTQPHTKPSQIPAPQAEPLQAPTTKAPPRPEPTPRRDPVPENPPAPTREPPPSTGPTMEQVVTYIRGYRGGDCFFLNATTVSAQEAVIEAYGTVSKPFQDFDEAFKKTFGFEAKIQLRQVERGHCPVVELLARQAQLKPTNVPKLRLDSDRLRSGEELRGVIDLGEAQNVTLLLVERDGSVHDLAHYLKRSGRQVSFSVRLEVPPAAQGRAQLVLAVGSQVPVLPSGAQPNGAAIFAGLAQEVERAGSGLGLAVRLIKVGN